MPITHLDRQSLSVNRKFRYGPMVEFKQLLSKRGMTLSAWFRTRVEQELNQAKKEEGGNHD